MDTQNVYNMEQAVSVNSFINIEVAEGEVVGFQITARNGADLDRIVVVTDTAVKAYQALRQAYPKPNGAVEKVAPKPAVTETPEREGKAKRDYTKPVPVNELPLELTETSVDVFVQEFDWFVVEPKPDEKASVKFYKDGLEFPVGAYINNWKHETVNNALAPLGDIDASKAEKHRIAGDQYWKKGTEYTNKKGFKSNYKDFLLVQSTL